MNTTVLAVVNRMWTHIALVVMCVLFAFSAPIAAQPADGAGLLVDYGNGQITYVWSPVSDEMTVIDLLGQTDLDLVTVDFGGMGAAICQIETTGCPAAECRARLCQVNSSSPFWRFLKLHDGQWVMVGTGVSGAKVVQGDVYMLSWSAVSPDVPTMSIDEVALKVGVKDDDAHLAMVTVGDAPAVARQSWQPLLMAGVGVAIVAAVLAFRADLVRRSGP